MNGGYIKLKSVGEIGRLKGKVRFLAGGTDLFVMLGDGLLEGETFCDISSLKGLDRIEEKGGKIKIGALVTFAKIDKSALLKKNAACLVEAAAEVGAPLIRNAATIGGNVANASPSGDSLPALFVLGAKIVTNKRTVKVDRFLTGPKTCVLGKNELITHIVIPKEKAYTGFYKVGPRKAMAISKVSAAVSISFDKGKIASARIAFGAVAATVVRAAGAEKILKGKKLTPEIIRKAAKAASLNISPIDDFRSTAAYRKKVAGVILERLLSNASAAGRSR